MKWVSITTDKPKYVCRLNVYQSIHVTWCEIHRNCRWLLNINESLVVPLRLFNFITIYWVLNLLNYKNVLLVSSKVVEIQFLMLIILLQSQWKKNILTLTICKTWKISVSFFWGIWSRVKKFRPFPGENFDGSHWMIFSR